MERRRIGLFAVIATDVAIIAVGAIQALAITLTESLLPQSWGWTNQLWVWILVLALSTLTLIVLIRAKVKSTSRAEDVRSQLISTESRQQKIIVNGQIGDIHNYFTEVSSAESKTSSRQQHLDAEEVKARARQAARLKPFIPSEKLDELIAWMNQGPDPAIEFQSRDIRAIVGPIGSGKTEVAHRWFMGQIADARNDPKRGVPIWLENRLLRSTIEEAIESSNPEQSIDPSAKTAVVLDGLDQGSIKRGKQLLREAREYAYANPNVTFLLTSRPGLGIDPDESASIDPWNSRRGITLIELVTGKDFRYDFMVPEVMEALESPLLSLALADRLRNENPIQVSRWDLLSGLAQSVLKEERPSDDLWGMFAQLAENVLDSDSSARWGNFDEDPETWKLTDSQIVAKDAEGLTFVLPVFEHFFGARSLIEGRRSIESVVVGDLFPRWRYAIAFAVATNPREKAEALLRELAVANPGAFSWVLEEVTSTSRTALSDAESAGEIRELLAQGSGAESDSLTVGRWLRTSYDTIVKGLGPVGSLLDGTGPKGEAEQWGVWITDDHLWLNLAEAYGIEGQPDLVELEEPWPRRPRPWSRISGGRAPSGPYSCWLWGRDRLRGRLEQLLRDRTLPCSPESPLAKERVWYLAHLVLFHRIKFTEESIRVDKVRDEISRMLAFAKDSVRCSWQFGGAAAITSEDVWWLYSALERFSSDVIERPWVAPDRLNVAARTVEEKYSPEQTVVLARQVLEAALGGYRDVVETNFPSFGGALGLYGVMPVGLDGLVSYSEDAPLGMRGSLGLRWRYLDDADRDSESIVQVGLSRGVDDEIAFYNRLDSEQGASSPLRRARFFDRGISQGVLDIFGPRAATNLAYEWLGSDLHSLGWIKDRPHYFGH